ncbi:MAG: transcriptional regulator [Calditrichaeota bacterium]|nr:MAG: transcriptional regulator [Calditrichota bacterium]
MQDFANQAVKIFKALADPTRYRIVTLLLERGELGCADFNEAFPYSKSAMSHHYRILENANLITTRKEGQHVRVRINRDVLDRFLPDFDKVHVGPSKPEDK